MSLIAQLLPEAKSKKNPAGWLYKALLEKYDRPLSANEKHAPDIECTICHGTGYYKKTENDREIMKQCNCWKTACLNA